MFPRTAAAAAIFSICFGVGMRQLAGRSVMRLIEHIKNDRVESTKGRIPKNDSRGRHTERRSKASCRQSELGGLVKSLALQRKSLDRPEAMADAKSSSRQAMPHGTKSR
jgi:hypothetical protein